jgi:cold-inducible RNA-binding protein
MGTKLFLGNLAWSLSEEGLAKLCEPFGEVASSNLLCERRSGKSRGFGFVEMVEEDAARAAAEKLDGQVVDGRPIRVEISLSRETD